MKTLAVYEATDGSRWDTPEARAERDTLDAIVRDIEATIPAPPDDSHERRRVDPEAFTAAKVAVVELCRQHFPREAVFRHDPMSIHPFSFAGRFLDDVGGPLRRVWQRFMCHADGWIYQQPYYALNPDQFKESR